MVLEFVLSRYHYERKYIGSVIIIVSKRYIIVQIGFIYWSISKKYGKKSVELSKKVYLCLIYFAKV